MTRLTFPLLIDLRKKNLNQRSVVKHHGKPESPRRSKHSVGPWGRAEGQSCFHRKRVANAYTIPNENVRARCAARATISSGFSWWCSVQTQCPSWSEVPIFTKNYMLIPPTPVAACQDAVGFVPGAIEPVWGAGVTVKAKVSQKKMQFFYINMHLIKCHAYYSQE